MSSRLVLKSTDRKEIVSKKITPKQQMELFQLQSGSIIKLTVEGTERQFKIIKAEFRELTDLEGLKEPLARHELIVEPVESPGGTSTSNK